MQPEMTENDRLDLLKNILFTEDREHVLKISKRIQLLEALFNEKQKLAGKVDPIIDERLQDFTRDIPKTLGPTITATLKEQIRVQKDEVVDALYPIMGKMIKKYVAQEIKLLQERIDNQFSFIARWKMKMRSFFGNVKEEELILSQMGSAQIQQVFLIERDSGILKASYSKSKTIDEEMISGMLTAIKSFVEDAFQQKGQNLELIEYEFYHIHLQSFVTHYVAVVLSGNYTNRAKNRLQDIIFNFYKDFMEMNLDLVFDVPTIEGPSKAIDARLLERELAKSFGNAKI